MKKYKVKLYYSTFIEKEVGAGDLTEAVIRAREEEPVFNKRNWSQIADFINNREPWKDADEAEEIGDD